MNDRTQGVMFSTQSDEWGTPQDLFDKLKSFAFKVLEGIIKSEETYEDIEESA